MPTSSQTSPGQAQHQTTPNPLIPLQLASMEAARVVWEMLGEEHLENFAVVGGAALLFYGSTIMTNDADLAITGDSYTKFLNAVKEDRRFSEGFFGKWEYWSSYDFMVEIDFINKNGDGDYLHELRGYSLIDGIPVARLVDLAIGKGTAWVQRKNQKDFTGLKYAVMMMAQRGLDFKGLDEQAKELFDDITMKLMDSPEGRQLLQIVRRLW
ncbi:hypothetical protein B9Z19DRAFT_1065995 [Tuber borchii]|uniref:Uncharacterized protein n=1 Tax=Tuber borchii TaxID=42251 RepID=A0A2T6ZP55_TUBBO|nr:hypothetical protein B9Z19DRAFT_1065995 [Tuber borchii]